MNRLFEFGKYVSYSQWNDVRMQLKSAIIFFLYIFYTKSQIVSTGESTLRVRQRGHSVLIPFDHLLRLVVHQFPDEQLILCRMSAT